MTYFHSKMVPSVHPFLFHMSPSLVVPLTSVSILLLGLLILPPVPPNVVGSQGLFDSPKNKLQLLDRSRAFGLSP